MYSQTIAFPILLLRNIAVWDESIDKRVPLVVFKVYRFLIRYMFVYCGSICETVHLKAYESFEVWPAFDSFHSSWTELRKKTNNFFPFSRYFVTISQSQPAFAT